MAALNLYLQQLHMTGYITLLWNDTRVKVTGERESDGTVILDKSCLSAVWTPDIWIERLVEFTQQKVTGIGSKVAYQARQTHIIQGVRKFATQL